MTIRIDSASVVDATAGWFYWSNPAVWPNGIVPGLSNSSGVDATIPCNTGIILDVPVITLGTLTINGLMK